MYFLERDWKVFIFIIYIFRWGDTVTDTVYQQETCICGIQ